MQDLHLSSIAVMEIVSCLEEHSKRWKFGMSKDKIPFSDIVIQHIKEQSIIKGE